ncbi:MAG: hypothetical protein ABL888_08625 [Pirellulaceae bacterium]
MTSGIRKFGQREEVPDDWFGGGDDKDQQPRLPPSAELPRRGQEPKETQGKIRRFFGWIVRPFWPSSRTRLVFLLTIMLALPIAFDIGNQFVVQNGDRYTVYLVAGAWAFLIGLMAFTLGAVAMGSLSKWERIVVLATAAVATSLHWLYVTTGVKIFDIGYGIEQFQTQKAMGAILLCGTTLIASAGLQRLLKNRETQLLRWGGDVRMNLIAVAIALASIFGIVSLTSGQDFALIDVFRQLNWLGLGVLFALLGVVVPVLVLNYSANLFWMSVWMPVCAGWGLAVLSLLFDYFSVDGGMMMGMAFTYGCGILVASFGTYRNRHQAVRRKAWSWPWAVVWNTPVIAVIVVLLYINNQFYVPAIYQKNGFQWDMARELGRLNQFATVNYRWGHLDLDFTKNENQELVSGNADTSLGYPMVSFSGINEKLNLNALPNTAAQVAFRRSQVSVEQLASLTAASLLLENATVVHSPFIGSLIGIKRFYLQGVTPGTLSRIIENHADPKGILLINVMGQNLSRGDWESLAKLDPKAQIYLSLRSNQKVADASDDFTQILQRLPKENPVWLDLHRSSSNANDVQFLELILDLVGTHLNLRWSTDEEPDSIDKSEIAMMFDALFLTNRSTALELDKLYDAIHDLNPEVLSEYHLLYSKSDSVQPNALYLPAAGKFVFDQVLASTLESISFEKSWRLGYFTGVIDVDLDEQLKGLVFAAKELYLDGSQKINVLEMFPNLEILQIAESPMAPWRMKSLVELQLQFKNQTKLKKIIVKSSLNATLLEALGQITTLEELVVSKEAVDSYGLDKIQELVPKVKITVLKANDDAWIPQHFRDHQQRVFANLREKYRKKIEMLQENARNAENSGTESPK